MNMTEILKEVGRGKRGARDLNYEEALAAAEMIFNKTASPAQIGAFFLAERIKMESVDELYAFVKVCRSHAVRMPRPDGLDCAGPYDGRKSSFMAGFATAFVLAAAGSPVTLHGTESLPPKWGVTLPDLLREMGLDGTTPTRDQALQTADETGVLFVPAEAWCPPLGSLRAIREELGLRTILNTVEKLVDYSHSPYLVYGVFHNTVFDRTAQLLQRLNYRKALIVQGAEGSEDAYIDRPTRTYLVEEGEANLHMIDPETYGLESSIPDNDWTAAEQLRITEAVLTGDAPIAFINQVILNGALRLHLVGLADSVEEGIYISKSLLENGLPWQAFCRWKEAMLQGQLAKHSG
ncbi:anthranilate phosphoribosyltransferase [Fontibacillus phaseoli]|uniref:Anthranilate phosphoribosyltransferase n=1 Tax=Fontibacillus phaseoli TaxID=1416533 RepID=A0A369B5I0_9BACL|nr:anthranilate phosphoribosyltransferase [Fontibacillus phaseoli]RCX16743.1 anthranilate phosphoribosyltransferase [Fontibacillus phaseoli]